VYFSELDVSIFVGDIDSSPAGQQKLAERRQLQADVYRALLHIALTHSNVVAYVMFAWANTYTWIGYDISQEALVGKYGDLGIYDENWEPKPAYYALLDELKGSEP
jgi:GH35 family endo-1,4-beta-xylanase